MNSNYRFGASSTLILGGIFVFLFFSAIVINIYKMSGKKRSGAFSFVPPVSKQGSSTKKTTSSTPAVKSRTTRTARKPAKVPAFPDVDWEQFYNFPQPPLFQPSKMNIFDYTLLPRVVIAAPTGGVVKVKVTKKEEPAKKAYVPAVTVKGLIQEESGRSYSFIQLDGKEHKETPWNHIVGNGEIQGDGENGEKSSKSGTGLVNSYLYKSGDPILNDKLTVKRAEQGEFVIQSRDESKGKLFWSYKSDKSDNPIITLIKKSTKDYGNK